MPSIPFPNVPAFPGVPALTRPVSAAIARTPALAIALGSVENILIQALQQTPQWGIFDAQGNQLGVDANSNNSILLALSSQITGATTPVVSTLGIDYVKEMRVSDFPVEPGSFASYNKVETPANPLVTLTLAGSEDDRTIFLNAIDAACISTNLYNVLTPEVQYVGYTIERYTYSRRASRGATLLVVEISLKQIRQVSAALTVAAKPIVKPQDPAATPQTNSGMTQGAAPDTSTLKSLTNKLFGGK